MFLFFSVFLRLSVFLRAVLVLFLWVLLPEISAMDGWMGGWMESKLGLVIARVLSVKRKWMVKPQDTATKLA